MISITPKAIEKVKEISEAEGVGHTSIRVKVVGGGCAGFTHDMFYDNKQSDVDEVYTEDGVTVLIDPLSFQYLEDIEIDYQASGFTEGFKFNNPNVKGSCGCGSSVSY